MLIVALVLLLAEPPDKPLAGPQALTGRVVAVADGDTLTVLDSEKTQHKIRLASIDAPESKQAFGTRAKQALADRVAGRDVRIEWTAKDRYGRILGNVYVGGDVAGDGRRWVNRGMIEAGFAWHYRQYSKSKDLQEAEDLARKEKRGLWADKEPTPPWEWRKERRSSTPAATARPTR